MLDPDGSGCQFPPDAHERGERLVHLVVNDLLGLNVEPLEDGLVEGSAAFVGGVAVQLGGVVQQRQGGFDHRSADPQFVGRLLLPGEQGGSLFLDRLQALADLGLGQVAVSGEVEQVLFLHVEPSQFGSSLVSGHAGGGLVVGQDAPHLLPYLGNEVGRETERGVVPSDGIFHVLGSDEGCDAAEAFLSASAEEVGVVAAVSLGDRQDDSVVLATFAAGTAPQAALEVVMMGTLTLVGTALSGEDLLHPVEQGGGDQRLVATVVLLAAMEDTTEVVAVRQHPSHRLSRRWLGRVLAGAGAQASGSHLLHQVGDGELASSEELEGLPDQWRPFLIDRHCGDHSSLEVLADVPVAERRQADGAAPLGLLAHFVANVGAVLGRAKGVDGREEAEGELSGWGVVDVLGSRDYAGTPLLDLVDRGSGLNPVPVESGHLVDDHEVDVSGFLETLHHGLEGGPALDVGGRTAGLDVLPDDLYIAHPLDLPLAGLALGRNGQSLRVVVGVDLTGRGHP